MVGLVRHNSFAEVIADGAARCGSQNKLARFLGTNSGNLSGAKAGTKVLTADQIKRLAQLVGSSERHVWTLQSLVRAHARNPFPSPAPAASGEDDEPPHPPPLRLVA